MNEFRSSPRLRALKGARIVYDGGTTTRDCTIRNISAGGAKLVMETTIHLPDTFMLLFEDGTKKSCRACWRKVNELGVEFIELA